MSGAVVVGYTATDAGRDALAVGVRLAVATHADLHLVLVLPADERSVITPPDAGYGRHLRTRAEGWLAEAASSVTDAVTRRTAVRAAESFAAGLIEAAGESGAGLIVVGAANGGLRGRHRLGAVATELLHSSDVPVVLAPSGAAEETASGVSRVTAAVGTRAGADVLLDEAVALAASTSAPLRLVSLVPVDLPSGLDTGIVRIAGAAHTGDVLAAARRALPDGIAAEAVAAEGASIEEAVERIDWDPAEVLVVGSSRLAQPRRLFLGSTAATILHVLPVPMIVVPRTRQTTHPAATEVPTTVVPTTVVPTTVEPTTVEETP